MRPAATKVLLVLMLLLSACSSSTLSQTEDPLEPFPTAEVLGSTVEREPTPTEPTPGRPSRVPDIPDVDSSVSSFPLSDIIFDTFGQGPLSFPDSTAQDRADLLDLIPPLDDPAFVTAGEDPWLAETDMVTGFVDADGTAYAFPHSMMARHEIVNATFAGQPVVVTYCPLCDTSVVFSRQVEDRPEPLLFSNTSALLYNDMVMVDRATGSYWWQVAGQAVVGQLTETQLPLLSSFTNTWKSWSTLHPETLVLSRDTGYSRDYTANSSAGYVENVDEGFTPFPVPAEVLEDERLTPASRVLVVEGVDEAGANAQFAVAIDQVRTRAVPVQVDNRSLVVLISSGSSAVFVAEINGQPVEFEVTPAGFVTTDGSMVDLAGRVLSGLGEGQTLEPYPSRTGFWFSILSLFPQVQLVPDSGDAPE